LPLASADEATRFGRVSRRNAQYFSESHHAAWRVAGAHMKDQSTTNCEALRVRPLEARDLKDAGERFPGAMVYVHAGPTDSIPSFLERVDSRRHSAWVAEAEGRIIGMAVVAIESQSLARLMYLHVTAVDGVVSHDGVAKALADIAIRDAWEGGYLKLVVHARIPADHVIEYMHDLGFEFARTQPFGSQRVVEFYRNPYEPPRDLSSPPPPCSWSDVRGLQ
jgi:N-acetylglutamate synthase-like GNAT family acetyltransferase